MAKNTPYFGSNYLPTVIIVFILWVAVYSQALLHLAEISSYVAVGQSLVFSGLLFGIGYILLTSLQFYQPTTNRYLFFPAIVFVASVLVIGLTQFLVTLKNLENPLFWLQIKSFWLNFIVAIVVNGFVTAIAMLWYRISDQQAIENRQKEMEKLAKEAEMFQLRHQMQPHFLFNSLNSINALISINAAEARKMITSLSSFLRHSIKADDRVLVQLKDEIEHLNLYLDIEKVRFGHRLTTQVWLDNACENCQLPPLLLQPLLENAIKFGLYGTTENVAITLNAKCMENFLHITITNPIDEEAEAQSGSKFGLSAVRRRLFLVYERNDLLETKATPELFVALLKIPQQQ